MADNPKKIKMRLSLEIITYPMLCTINVQCLFLLFYRNGSLAIIASDLRPNQTIGETID